MSRIKKPTLTEPVAPAGNPTMAYLEAKYAYHKAWSEYYGAKSARYGRMIFAGITCGLLGVALVAAIVGAVR